MTLEAYNPRVKLETRTKTSASREATRVIYLSIFISFHFILFFILNKCDVVFGYVWGSASFHVVFCGIPIFACRIPYDRKDLRACFQTLQHSVFDHLHCYI